MSPIFDSHLHIIDPAFPLVANDGYLPEPFRCADYLAAVGSLPVVGGAVVSGSFQAFDQGYLVAALRELGPAFVGVTQLPAGCSDADVAALHEAGVRAVRFNLVRGGSAGLNDIAALGRRVHDVAGWHSEFYVRNTDLAELAPILTALPAISIDHLGLTSDGVDVLLDMVARGARVKASGFGRGDVDVPQLLRRIARLNPGALMFGTDLPGTRAPRPFVPSDVHLLQEAVDDAALAERALYDNAAALYHPGQPPSVTPGTSTASGGPQ